MPERAAQLLAGERPEPPSVPALGQRARRRDLAREEVVVRRRVLVPPRARPRCAARPRPASPRRPPACGAPAGRAGRAGGTSASRAHHGGDARGEVERGELRGRAGLSADAVDADRAVVGVRELAREERPPRARVTGRRRARHEDEVAPPEARVRGRAHDEMAAAVGHARARALADHQVRPVGEGAHVHGCATIPAAPISPRNGRAAPAWRNRVVKDLWDALVRRPRSRGRRGSYLPAGYEAGRLSRRRSLRSGAGEAWLLRSSALRRRDLRA